MKNGDAPIEHELVRNGTLFENLEILNTRIEPTVDNEDVIVTIDFRVEAELVETCAFGLLYVLGLLSFHDGRPRGISGQWFEDDDHFTAGDMLRHLHFESDTLRMDIDYLRGRCIKTELKLSSEGHGRLTTANRGQAATRWLDRLKGRTFLRAVD